MTASFLTDDSFLVLPQVESTNNYATGMVHAGMAHHGLTVFTKHQTAGKGQRSRTWQSEAGSNIAMSIVLQPPALVLSQSFLLSAATALAVHRFFSGCAGTETKVKWPNDLYWRDGKAGGILIENVVKGSEWKAAVIGIGINVNQTHFEGLKQKAVSLKQITGKEHDPEALARTLHKTFLETYQIMQQRPLQVLEDYNANLYKRSETVRLKQGNRVFEGTIKNVTALGELVVQHATEESFRVGEVEWII